MLVDRVCQQCQKPFKTQAYRLLKGRGKFCSRACNSRAGCIGKQSRNWKGGRHMLEGYIIVRHDGPMATVQQGKYAFEHRLVAAQILGRDLLDKEIVHHINGNKTDNRPENLSVMTQGEHIRVHCQKVTPELLSVIRARRVAGERMVDIAASVGLHFGTLYKWVKRAQQ